MLPIPSPPSPNTHKGFLEYHKSSDRGKMTPLELPSNQPTPNSVAVGVSHSSKTPVPRLVAYPCPWPTSTTGLLRVQLFINRGIGLSRILHWKSQPLLPSQTPGDPSTNAYPISRPLEPHAPTTKCKLFVLRHILRVPPGPISGGGTAGFS